MGEKLSYGADTFAGREAARDVFWNTYEQAKHDASKKSKNHVLAYIGEDGIGKTALLRQIMRELDKRIDDPLYMYFDFKINQEPLAMLRTLRDTLSQKHGFTFPFFDIALRIYTQKMVEESDDKAIDEQESLRWQELVSLELAFSDNMFDQLSLYFAKDLNENLKDRTEPLVIFLDSYNFQPQKNSKTSFLGSGDRAWSHKPMSSWLHNDSGLIKNTYHVLWVLTGRNEISFATNQYSLEAFTESETSSFLEEVGITDSVAVTKLHRKTGGVPLHLMLCVNNYYSFIEVGRQPNMIDCVCSREYLVGAFINRVYESQKDVFYLLCCMGIWDDATFYDMISTLLPDFPPSLYDGIKKRPFIWENNGIYIMQPMVSEIILKDCPESTRRRFCDALARYYEEKLRSLKPIELAHSQLLPRYADVIKHTLWGAENPISSYADVIRHTSPGIKELMRGRRSRYDAPEINVVLNRSGRGKLNEKNAQNIMDSYYQVYGVPDEGAIKVQRAVSNYYDSSNNYKNACDLLEKIYMLAVEALGEDHSTSLSIMEDLGDVYCCFPYMHDTALTLYEQIFMKLRKDIGGDHINTIRIVRSLGRNYPRWSRSYEALVCFEYVVLKFQKLLGMNNPDTLKAMIHLSIFYRKFERYQDALELRTKVLAGYRLLLGEDHEKTIEIMSLLASSYDDLNRYKEELQILEDVLKKKRSILGNNALDTVTAMNNVALVHSKMNNENEALKLRMEILLKYKELLGENDEATLNAMTALAKSYESLGHHSEAAELLQRVSEKRQMLDARKKGEKTSDVNVAMDKIEEDIREKANVRSPFGNLTMVSADKPTIFRRK